MHDSIPDPRSLAGTLWTGRERDACGMGFVAQRDGRPSRRVLELGLGAVERLTHRGAIDDSGQGEPTGDGAGVLTQVPWSIVAPDVDVRSGRVGLGMCFLPREPDEAARSRAHVETAAAACGVEVIRWRDVPVDDSVLGSAARATAPRIEQVVLGLPQPTAPELHDALLYRVRRTAENAARAASDPLYVASMSSRTVVYKALAVGTQLRRFYRDLTDPAFETALCVFHQRYSTNTFPTWERAQPARTIAHNGEINTLHGNVSWMRARAGFVGWPEQHTGPDDDGSWLQPVIDEHGSDSAMLDDALQLLVHGGRSLPGALTMLVPPAWDHDQDLDPGVRDLLRSRAAATEPWDGPAALAFSDGVAVGTCLDRNGLRPARWLLTDDDLVACASEVGAVDVPASSIVRSGRLGPGQMLFVDTSQGTILSGDAIVQQLAAAQPWGVLVAAQQVDVPDSSLPTGDAATPPPAAGQLTARHALFGYTREELTAVIRPMVQGALPAVGSMGDDTPIAPLAGDQPRSLFSVVRQSFAEVTNPPIDPLRERATMSLDTIVGPRTRLLQRAGTGRIGMRLRSPLLTNEGMTRLRQVAAGAGVSIVDLETLIEQADAADAELVARRVAELCDAAESAVRDGADVVVLTDRAATSARPPLPALLAASAVHQRLVATVLRTRAGLMFETGELREPHHLAALVGHGIGGICPWLAIDTVVDLAEGPRARLELDGAQAQRHLFAALEYGLRTAMSRMGISTLDGYRGAQVFEAVGLAPEVADPHFDGTLQRPGRIDWAWIADRIATQAERAAAWESADTDGAEPLASPGFYKFKRGGELHGFDPAVVAALRGAVSVDDPLGSGLPEARERYARYVQLVGDRPPIDVRDLLEPAPAGAPVAIDEVEPVDAILARFSTGAMSHGSLGSEAHELLAVAMNRLGGASNSGEGGEAVDRFGTERCSAIKQVASGRFGVTPAYLRSARELQVKMAQGSKPGEGGHLPGHKVTEEIARIRHTAPGVSLISPPPHHDIYSIEDLAQLLHDLACVHPRARRSVKLVSQAGVGTIAAGVAKARANAIVISGASGGTGASPLGSIKYAGMPWEWGIAETQQVLVANRLRGRVRLRVDGGMRTGRDVLVAALLGADEFSFGTAALVAEGCRMARTCHNDKCPVGIATQRAELRALLPGTADEVAAFFVLVAEEVRALLASIGARTLDEVIGRPELLRPRAGDIEDPPVALDALLASPDVPADWPRHYVGEANDVRGVADGLDTRLARELLPLVDASGAVDARADAGVVWESPIDNGDRSVGARISGELAQHVAADGIRAESLHARFVGVAGQSFGAFAIRGLRLELEGEANDFVGKGLGGASIDVRFPIGSARAAEAHRHVIVGNACLYGATSGLLLVAGRAGERFAVRNSGATAVVEGTGDHCCEYMTGGEVVVLGRTGRNVAAGMSGGRLWVIDSRQNLDARLADTAEVIEPSPADFARLRGIVELHAQRTASTRARWLLDHWDQVAPWMTCIAPKERDVSAGSRSPHLRSRTAS